MAAATIAQKYISAPRATWDGTEKIPLDVGGSDGVGLASTLKTFIVGDGSVAVSSTKTLTVTGDATIASTPPVLGANTFTALQTITQASANAGIIASTGYSLTGSNATGMVSLAGTLNTSGNPSVIKLAITNTAAGATTKLVDILAGAAGATPLYYLQPNGFWGFQFPSNSTGRRAYTFEGDGANQIRFRRYTDDFAAAASTIFSVNNGVTTDTLVLGAGAFDLGSGILSWGTGDVRITRNAANKIDIQANTTGAQTGIHHLSELLTIAASATSTTTIQKPANSIILGVDVRVTTAVTCTSTFTVGDSGSAARFSTAGVSKAVNSTDPGTKAGAYYNATAEGIVITPDTTPSDATGRVRVTIHYLLITPSTS